MADEVKDEKPQRSTVAAQWKEFALAIWPDGARPHPIQFVEMRRAFYGGCSAMFFLMTILDSDAEPTDEDVAYMESLFQELETFKNLMAAGLK